jgi:hypothetical protein
VKGDSKREEKGLVLWVQLGSKFIYDIMILDKERFVMECR